MATAVGLVLWTLFEYVAHRFVFHMELSSERGRWLMFLLHGNHHQDPADPLRGLMPLAASLPLGALFWLVALVALDGLGHAVFLGFGTGYVVYDATHWACHQAPMRGRLGTAIKRHHLRHHHAGRPVNYAITAIFWDRAFGSGLRSRRPR